MKRDLAGVGGDWEGSGSGRGVGGEWKGSGSGRGVGGEWENKYEQGHAKVIIRVRYHRGGGNVLCRLCCLLAPPTPRDISFITIYIWKLEATHIPEGK